MINGDWMYRAVWERLKKNLSKMYEETVFTVNDLGSRPRHANKVITLYSAQKLTEKWLYHKALDQKQIWLKINNFLACWPTSHVMAYTLVWLTLLWVSTVEKGIIIIKIYHTN